MPRGKALSIDTIREVLSQHANLAVDVRKVTDDTDLYSVGLTSHASVNVLLGLEDALDVEFPDSLLQKSTFHSINSIRDAIAEIRSS